MFFKKIKSPSISHSRFPSLFLFRGRHPRRLERDVAPSYSLASPTRKVAGRKKRSKQYKILGKKKLASPSPASVLSLSPVSLCPFLSVSQPPSSNFPSSSSFSLQYLLTSLNSSSSSGRIASGSTVERSHPLSAASLSRAAPRSRCCRLSGTYLEAEDFGVFCCCFVLFRRR